MKKIMMIIAAVAIAGIANAGAVNWGSGAIQTPGLEGVLSGSKLTSSSGYTLQMFAFESLNAFSYEAGDLFAWYSADTTKQFNGLTAIQGSVNIGASATTATANGAALTQDGGVNVYGAVLFVLTDTETGKAAWYMENDAIVATKSGTTKASISNLALKENGNGAAMTWTAVPEPTSGLLMLVGLAGLALRRRRA